METIDLYILSDGLVLRHEPEADTPFTTISVHPEDIPVLEPKLLQDPVLFYLEQKFEIRYRYSKNRIWREIYAAKASLSRLDYQSIKMTEYRQMGQPDPYDPDALFAQKENLRVKINEYQALLQDL